jgi:hypothetical protein
MNSFVTEDASVINFAKYSGNLYVPCIVNMISALLSRLATSGFLFKGHDWPNTEHVYDARCSKKVIFVGTKDCKL